MDIKKSPLLGFPALMLLVLLIITFIPFLGETLFNTKGEPREAVVAVSMLQSGNWILPVSNGADIPYKPPMLAWIIAVFGWFNGGEVTEFLSRLPSALSAIVMIMWGYLAARKEAGEKKALLMAAVIATSFEVHRAATNCRVDMLLTMFMVCGLYAMFRRFNEKNTLFSVAAVLLFSGAVLTKGPVGVVLPLIVMWVFALLSGGKFWKVSLEALSVGILSLVIPFFWYYAAYQQGGQNFLDLVMEENFGRMTGTMSYESHVNPWWYNILTILSGMAPYTLLAVIAAIPLAVASRRKGEKSGFKAWWRRFRADRWALFMALAAVIVFVFYCFPKSKRSVYLLPMYPMLAWYVVEIAVVAARRSTAVLRWFAGITGLLMILFPMALLLVRYNAVTLQSASLQMYVRGISQASLGFSAAVCAALSIVLGWYAFAGGVRKNSGYRFEKTILAVFAGYWFFSSFAQPALLNIKSHKPVAQALAAYGYGTEKSISGWCADPLMRHYMVDFYLGDKIKNVVSPAQKTGDILVSVGDMPEFVNKFGHRVRHEVILHFTDPSGKEERGLAVIRLTDRTPEERRNEMRLLIAKNRQMEKQNGIKKINIKPEEQD